jgi:putative ABC transport system permease protein
MREWKWELEQRLAASHVDPATQPALIEELAQHLADRYAELVSGGMEEAAAREAVLTELANVQDFATTLPSSKRERREAPALGSGAKAKFFAEFRRDLAYGWRAMRKAPLFAVFAILTLALGIGANTTVFTVINTLLLHPMPVADSSRLVVLYDSISKTAEGANNRLLLSYANWQDYAKAQTAFDGMAAFTGPRVMTVRTQTGQARVFADFVSAEYFKTLGLRPASGRFFLPGEVRQRGSSPMAVLSYNAWRSRFAGAADVAGRTIELNGIVFTVVGIAPKGFLGISAVFGPDAWLPATMYERASGASAGNELSDRGKPMFHTVARLRPGVGLKEAERSFAPLSASLAREYPNTNEDHTLKVRPITDELFSNIGGANGIVFGSAVLFLVVSLILGIACSNVANLLLARSAARRQEFAVRLAIGASRGRLIRQLLAESLLLSLWSCVLGLAVGEAGCRFIWSFVPPQVSQNIITPRLDASVVVFAIAVSLVTAFVFGLAPAVQGSRTDVAVGLKEESRTAGRSKRAVTFANALLAGQVAFSLICLFAATLFFRSIERAYSVSPGFQTSRLALFMTSPEQAGYNETRVKEFYRVIRDRVSALPGIYSVAWASGLPFWNSPSRTVSIEGMEQRKTSQTLTTIVTTVDPGFFQTMDIAAVSGRVFNEFDREESAPVALINEYLARQRWPGSNALGHRIQLAGEKRLRQVVGVVRNANYTTLGESPQACVYLPLRQNFVTGMTLYVRTKGDPAAQFAPVQNVIRDFDPKILAGDSTGLTGPRVGSKLIEQVLWGPRIGVSLLGIFGLMALALATVGLYGVMVYSVNRRTKEIGLRIALGASHSVVLRLILRDGMRVVVSGVAIGLLACLLLGRLLSRVLFGLSSADPLSFMAAGSVLIGVALLACYFPARSATRVDPMVALRDL